MVGDTANEGRVSMTSSSDEDPAPVVARALLADARRELVAAMNWRIEIETDNADNVYETSMAFQLAKADAYQRISAARTAFEVAVRADERASRSRSLDWIVLPVADDRVEQFKRTWAALLETYRGDADFAAMVLMAGMDQIANERNKLRAGEGGDSGAHAPSRLAELEVSARAFLAEVERWDVKGEALQDVSETIAHLRATLTPIPEAASPEDGER